MRPRARIRSAAAMVGAAVWAAAVMAVVADSARSSDRSAPATQTAPAAEVSDYDRALSLYREARFAEAAAILEHALPRRPSGASGHHALLGWCRFRLGRFDAALASFKEALRLSPGSADALEGVARAAARLERDTEAIDAVVALSRAHPDANVADVAGQILGRAGRLQDRRLGRSGGTAAPGSPRMVARARGDYLEVLRSRGAWTPIFVKGVNLGVALPGRHPAEFPLEREVYARWLDQIADMGANLVRLYTLLPPAFYEALAAHNKERGPDGGFLWLAQGVWTELPEDDAYDAPAFAGQFLADVERVIDAVHGNIAVAHRRGHAYGLYRTDVSEMTLCFILGREWEPYSVAAFDQKRPHPAGFRGRYFTLERGTPMEAWIASVMDHTMAYETGTYGEQRPVAFTNWPTLDPLHHPTEATSKEEVVLLEKRELPQEPGTVLEYDNDGHAVDPGRIEPTRLAPAGTFAAYHAYPYYPDFMNVDAEYSKARDRHGPSNYVGYLRQLKAHHARLPVLIAEFGVPTSRGIAHHQPQGWHHGGHTEREQGEIEARMFEQIRDTGCAGGILFAWLDEWFKKNWLVIAFEVPWDNNKNWLNVLDPEQNYGLLALKPGRDGWRIVIDGKGDDWAGAAPLAASGSGPLRGLRAAHDEAYLYLRLDVDRLDWDDVRYVVGIDTYGAAEGDHRMPFGLGLRTPTGMEFVVDLSGPAASRVLCDVRYDLHTNRFNRPWKSFDNDDGVFIEMLAETNRRRVGRDGTIYPAITYSRSPLRYGTMDPSSAAFDDLVEWRDNPEEGFIEMRLGWNLLNVTDPSTRQVLDDPVPPRGGAGHTTTDGFRFYAAAYEASDRRVIAALPAAGDGGRYEDGAIPFYTWEPWEEPTYHAYLKKSYHILRDRLPTLGPLEGSSR